MIEGWIWKPLAPRVFVQGAAGDSTFPSEVKPRRKDESRHQCQEFENSMERRSTADHSFVHAPFGLKRFPWHSAIQRKPQQVGVSANVICDDASGTGIH